MVWNQKGSDYENSESPDQVERKKRRGFAKKRKKESEKSNIISTNMLFVVKTTPLSGNNKGSGIFTLGWGKEIKPAQQRKFGL